LITLPVVYAGAIISWIGYHLGLVGTVPEVAGAHYVRLCLTMLTVVPLALAMVSVVPFGRIEQSLLVQSHGIGLWQKKALMAMRVFSHIAFFVLPKTLEVLREEQPVPRFHCRRQAFGIARTALLRSLLGYMVHLSVEIISAALQYIPLWAYEISRLPGDAEKRDT
jgi:hypothetical protein